MLWVQPSCLMHRLHRLFFSFRVFIFLSHCMVCVYCFVCVCSTGCFHCYILLLLSNQVFFFFLFQTKLAFA